MISYHEHLSKNITEPYKLEQVPTRDGFGKGLVDLGASDNRVVAVCADLAESTRMEWFKSKYPDRYIEVGVAEQNLACVGSGLANYGKIPFISSYASFSPGRNNEQIRTTISLTNLPVKIAGNHAGLSVGPDGATHQALEDIGLMRMQPNMTVFSPCDANEAYRATLASLKIPGPVYIRLAREKTPVFTHKSMPFWSGQAVELFEARGAEVAIVATGPLVYQALLSAHELYSIGIPVIVANFHTIKPLDEVYLYKLANKVKAIVTVEEHQIAGGFGSAVAEFLSENKPTRIEFVGVRDRFGQSGRPEELWAEYGLNKEAIKNAVLKVA